MWRPEGALRVMPGLSSVRLRWFHMFASMDDATACVHSHSVSELRAVTAGRCNGVISNLFVVDYYFFNFSSSFRVRPCVSGRPRGSRAGAWTPKPDTNTH